MSKHILIIGQGILGACTAFEIAQRDRNCRITVVASHPSHSGAIASGASWGWVNAHTDNDLDYFRFRNASRMLWHKILHNTFDLDAKIQPSIVYDLPKDIIAETADLHANWGYPVQEVSGDKIQQVLPIFMTPPDNALLTDGEVGVETEQVASQLLERSKAQLINAHVHALVQKGDTVTGVMTDQGEIIADHIILAAGHGIPKLLGTIGIHFELNSSIGLLVRTNPIAAKLSHMIMGPDFHVRQSTDGSLLIGGAFDADHGQNEISSSVDKLCHLVETNFDLSAKLEVTRFSLGKRVLPVDGYPKIGKVSGKSNLSAMAMHGGVTNAPLAAKTCIDEILGLERDPITLPYTFSTYATVKEKSHV